MSDRPNAPIIIKRKKVVAGGGHHGGAWKVAIFWVLKFRARFAPRFHEPTFQSWKGRHSDGYLIL